MKDRAIFFAQDFAIERTRLEDQGANVCSPDRTVYYRGESAADGGLATYRERRSPDCSLLLERAEVDQK